MVTGAVSTRLIPLELVSINESDVGSLPVPLKSH